MKQDRLNNYLLMQFPESITDTLDAVKIACATNNAKGIFKNLSRVMRMAGARRFKALRRLCYIYAESKFVQIQFFVQLEYKGEVNVLGLLTCGCPLQAVQGFIRQVHMAAQIPVPNVTIPRTSIMARMVTFVR